jgi:hypothetical protein
MVIPPRILYGLHEKFVLLSYERGARRSRLVLRAAELVKFCNQHFTARKPIMVGAPLVLGELLESSMLGTGAVPIVCLGHRLDRLKRYGADWSIRHHRAAPFTEECLRFETGTRMVYGTYTAYYSTDELIELSKEACHEIHPRTGVP